MHTPLQVFRREELTPEEEEAIRAAGGRPGGRRALGLLQGRQARQVFTKVPSQSAVQITVRRIVL